MLQQRRMSDAGMALTKQFEGLKLRAYQDCAGVWTVGYGHTGADVHTDLVITQTQAETLLHADLAKASACVHGAIKLDVAQGQFDALVDFCFNLGEHALLTSTLLRLVNTGAFQEAAEEFGKWVHAAGKVQPGLVARRRAEAEMFSKG